jgi:hypothetical protein
VSKMVIVVMSEMESERCGVGRFLAESLDWEFTEIDCICPADLRTPLVEPSDRNRQMQVLTDTISSAVYAWRDLVISSRILTHDEERQLRNRSTLVKFLYLTGADEEPHDAVDRKSSRSPSPQGSLHQCDEGVICVDRFQKADHILADTLCEVILKRKSQNGQS